MNIYGRVWMTMMAMGFAAVFARADGEIEQGQKAEARARPVEVGEMTVSIYTEGEPRVAQPSLFGDFPKTEIEAAIGSNKLMLATHFFSFVTDGKIVFVDSGTGGKDSPLQRLFPPRSRIRHPDAFLITHGHFDHIGGLLLGDAPRFPGAKVYISKPELEHWGKEENKDSPTAKAIAAYGANVVPFDFDTEVLPGVWARDASGHTPGSTVFETQDVYFVGDLLHVAALQFAKPDACASYDMDKDGAIAMRKAWLSKAAREGKPIVGAHFTSPVGCVREAKEGFIFVPQ